MDYFTPTQAPTLRTHTSTSYPDSASSFTFRTESSAADSHTCSMRKWPSEQVSSDPMSSCVSIDAAPPLKSRRIHYWILITCSVASGEYALPRSVHFALLLRQLGPTQYRIGRTLTYSNIHLQTFHFPQPSTFLTTSTFLNLPLSALRALSPPFKAHCRFHLADGAYQYSLFDGQQQPETKRGVSNLAFITSIV